MDLQLAGLSAVVTGAAGGIGRAVVELLSAEGVRVLAVNRNEIEPSDSVVPLVVDLAERGCGNLIAEAAQNHFGGLDLLVNNVGAAPVRESALSVSDDEWLGTWELNVLSVVRVCRATAPLLLRADRGRAAIVNVASTSGRYPAPILADYAASKAAVLPLTGSLKTELGRRGVRVNAVAPGPTRTPLWDTPGGFADAMAERYSLPKEEAVAHHISEMRRIALDKAGTAAEVADAVAFLLSARATHVARTVLAAHGAMATHLIDA